MTKVLFVDDEQFILNSYKRIFRDEMPAENLSYAISAEDALIIIPEFKPDIVLTDNNMLGMTGYELLKKIKENYPSIRRVLTSGRDIQHLKGDIAEKLVDKPADKDQLIAIIRELSQKPL